MKNILPTRVIDVNNNNFNPIYVVTQESDLVLNLEVLSNGKAFDMTGQTIEIRGNLNKQTEGITISGNKLTINLNNSFLSKVGKVGFELRIIDESGAFNSSIFYMLITENAVSRDAIISANYPNYFDKVVNDLKTDYEGLKKVIIDENVSANLQNQINVNKSETDKELDIVNSEILSNANEIADIILALAECIKKDGSAKIADFLDFGETGTNKLTGIRNNRGCEMLFQNQIQLRNTNTTETVNNFAVVFGGDGVYPGESSTGKLNLGAPSRPWKDVWVGSVNSHVLKGELTLTNGYKLKWIRYRTNNIINANVSHAEWATFNSPFSSEISTFGANCHYNLTEASRNIQGVVVNAHASDDKDALLIVIDGLSTIRGGCIYEILCWGIGR